MTFLVNLVKISIMRKIDNINLYNKLQDAYNHLLRDNCIKKSIKNSLKKKYSSLIKHKDILKKVELEYVDAILNRKTFIHKATRHIGGELSESEFNNLKFQDNLFPPGYGYFVINNPNFDIKSFYIIKDALQFITNEYLSNNHTADNESRVWLHICYLETRYLLDSHILPYQYAQNNLLDKAIDSSTFKDFLTSFYRPKRAVDIERNNKNIHRNLSHNKPFLNFISFLKEFSHLLHNTEKKSICEFLEKELANTKHFKLPTDSSLKNLPPRVRYQINYYLEEFLPFLNTPYNVEALDKYLENGYEKTKSAQDLIDRVDNMLQEGLGSTAQKENWPKTFNFLTHTFGFTVLFCLPLTVPLFYMQAKNRAKDILDMNKQLNENLLSRMPNISEAVFLYLLPELSQYYSKDLKCQLSNAFNQFMKSSLYKNLDFQLTPAIEQLLLEENPLLKEELPKKRNINKL